MMLPQHLLTSATPCVAARHVIGRLLDLSHISWRTCVADLLTDHSIGGIGGICAAPCVRLPVRLRSICDTVVSLDARHACNASEVEGGQAEGRAVFQVMAGVPVTEV